MGTENQVARGPRGRQQQQSAGTNVAVDAQVAELFKTYGIAAMQPGSLGLSSIEGLISYGQGGPIYDMVQPLGTVSRVVNSDENPFTNYAEASQGLASGEGGVSYSQQFDAFSLAVKDGKGIFYFSLLHDKDRNPQTKGTLVLCQVKLNRDFQIVDPSDNTKKITILQKGRVMFKALPMDYATKLKRAA